MARGIHLVLVLAAFSCVYGIAHGQPRLPTPTPEIEPVPPVFDPQIIPTLPPAQLPKINPTPPPKVTNPKREAMSYFALGIVSKDASRFGEAIEWFEKAIKLDPKGVPIYQELIVLYAGMNRVEDAIATCKTILKLDPKNVSTWHQYSRQLRGQGQTKEATEALEKALGLVDGKGHPDQVLQMNLELGELYRQDEKTKKAIAAFQTCSAIFETALKNPGLGRFERIKLSAKTASVYEQIGRLSTPKNPKQAIAAYRRAQALYPEGSHRWNLNLAEVYATVGENSKALKYLDKYLLFLPQRIEPYELKIQLLKRLDRQKEIIPWLEMAGKKDRFNISLQLLLANALADGGQPDQAEKLFQKLAKTNPGQDVYSGLFRLYSKSPKFGPKRILTTLDKTIAQADDEADILASTAAKSQAQAMLVTVRADKALAKEIVKVARPLMKRKHKFQPRTILLLAVLADQTDNYVGGEFMYRQLLKIAPKSMEPIAYDGLLRMLGRQYKHKAVVDVCNEAIQNARSLNESLLRARMANALGRLGRMDEALKEADRAIRFAGASSILTMQGLRIRLLVRAGKTKEAIQDCKALLKQYSEVDDLLTIRALLSHVYTIAGDIPKAEDQLQLILKIDPNNAGACNDLGYLWADRNKKLAEAEKLIRKAIKLDRQERTTFTMSKDEVPEPNAAYIDSLGWVLFRRGKFEAARVELERAVKLPGGEDPVIWDHLGDVYHQLNHTKPAIAAWEKALVLYDDARVRQKDERYQELRKKLKKYRTVQK